MSSTDWTGADPDIDPGADEYRSDPAASGETGTSYDAVTGEPELTPHDQELLEAELEASNPSAGGDEGLSGDLGISSERTGPTPETASGGEGTLSGIQGTGTVGSARGDTHGTVATETHGPEMDETQHEATQDWMDSQPGVDDPSQGGRETDGGADIDRTVGEHNPAEVPSHTLSHKNPGHSGR